MSIRQNSLAAHTANEFSGINQENELKILTTLKQKPWSTRQELEDLTGLKINIISGRCADLIRKNQIVEGGAKINPLTKKQCATLALKSDYERIRASM